ncbi:MAG: hypothetical protein R3321_13370, partial [Nitrososphaeraceae archaeon]|nr:hypothetical protein [Nitrososphaeraceae archaeon]
ISYLAKPVKKMKREMFLDAIMDKIYEDTGAYPYNSEDSCCGYIRWVENYIHPGDHYAYLDRDAIWSSSAITDHPFGRQKNMLKLGLIDSFNNINKHPSDDYVLKLNNLTPEEYKEMCKSL